MKDRLGIAQTSYSLRTRKGAGSAAHPGFKDALDLLRHCQSLGAGGAQLGVRGWDRAFAGQVRALVEKAGLYLEGQIGLPKDQADAARFEADLGSLREAGGRIARVVVLGGRRYEDFDRLDAYEAWKKRMWQSLALAEPAARRAGVRLAIENHKDLRIEDMREVLDRLKSEVVGICVDTGNSIALCEDPMEVVDAFAPHAISAHLKDMGVQAIESGFLLSEVPLGEGFLDLGRMVKTLRAANRDVAFSLEMITRDPLVVPCLTDKYWATMRDVPARDLGRTLGMVREKERVRKAPLPRITGLDPAAQLALEEEHVRRSLAYAKAKLGL